MSCAEDLIGCANSSSCVLRVISMGVAAAHVTVRGGCDVFPTLPLVLVVVLASKILPTRLSFFFLCCITRAHASPSRKMNASSAIGAPSA